MTEAPLTLNLAGWLGRSVVNGPGERFVLWVQGCPLRCPGCSNEDMWEFAPRRIVTLDKLEREILASGHLDGVTYSGGEPFSQAAALAELSRRLRARGYSILCYSGYDLDELKAGGPVAAALLAEIDVLVAGRFRPEERASLAWRGSRNQKIHFLSDRERACDDGAADRMAQLEIVAGAEAVTVTGIHEPTAQGLLSEALRRLEEDAE